MVSIYEAQRALLYQQSGGDNAPADERSNFVPRIRRSMVSWHGAILSRPRCLCVVSKLH